LQLSEFGVFLRLLFFATIFVFALNYTEICEPKRILIEKVQRKMIITKNFRYSFSVIFSTNEILPILARLVI
jgi:hypothetical protein